MLPAPAPPRGPPPPPAPPLPPRRGGASCNSVSQPVSTEPRGAGSQGRDYKIYPLVSTQRTKMDQTHVIGLIACF